MSPKNSSAIPVGVIGAGNISDQYLSNIAQYPDMQVVAIADADPQTAKTQAEKYGIAAWGTAQAVLDNPDIELVLNLTTPESHVPVSESIIGAGKHVWSEKVIGVNRDEARGMLDKAKAAGVRVGVAPDTVLGPGVQNAKRIIESGDIGTPLWASTQMQYQGPQVFHPNPAFLFAKGAGPLLDMGPYYLSALVHIFGSVASVAALGLKGTPTRRVEVGPKKGEEFPVVVPSTVLALMEFEEGAAAQSSFSNDSPMSRQGVFEIHGTKGSLVIPDPNTFEGEIHLFRPLLPDEPFDQKPEVIAFEGKEMGRGIGALDMLLAVRAGREHVATGEFGYHVLDALLCLEESAADGGAWKTVESNPGRTLMLPSDFNPFASALS